MSRGTADQSAPATAARSLAAAFVRSIAALPRDLPVCGYRGPMADDLAPWEAPFVVEVPDVPERCGEYPVPPVDRPVARRAARAGVVGVTVDHPLHDLSDYPAAHAEIVRAVEEGGPTTMSTATGLPSGLSRAVGRCSAPG